MAATVALKLQAVIKDISAHALVKSSDTSRSWAGTGDIDSSLSSTSTPDIENVAVFTATFTAGAVTIDLTSLTHADGDTRSAAGKKLRFIQVMNPSGNGTIRFKTGASNGHTPVGSALDVSIPASGAFLLYLHTSGADVTNSSNDTFDVTGTGTESFYVKLGWG